MRICFMNIVTLLSSVDSDLKTQDVYSGQSCLQFCLKTWTYLCLIWNTAEAKGLFSLCRGDILTSNGEFKYCRFLIR